MDFTSLVGDLCYSSKLFFFPLPYGMKIGNGLLCPFARVAYFLSRSSQSYCQQELGNILVRTRQTVGQPSFGWEASTMVAALGGTVWCWDI